MIDDRTHAGGPADPTGEAEVVLFMSSNGVGTGHLMRLMAMARRAERVSPLFVTLSQAVPVVRELGFPAEYIPSYAQTTFTYGEWHDMLRTRLREVIAAHGPRALVFDGTHPYVGLVRASEDHPDVPFVWSRRGMWRPDVDASTITRGRAFARIIEPGEIAASADRGATSRRRDEAVQVGPILLLDEQELLSSDAARLELGLDPDRPAALVLLGAGKINDVASLTGMVVDELAAGPDVQICVARSAIADDELDRPGDVRQISVYPLARYLRAFDLAVSASGYNSFHEIVCAGLPALFLPNVRTSSDDQRARAEHAERLGVALCAVEPDRDALAGCVRRLLDPDVREEMRVRAAGIEYENGAARAMAEIERVARPARATTSADTDAIAEDDPAADDPRDGPEPESDGVSVRLRGALAGLIRAGEALFRALPQPVKQVIRPVASAIAERLRTPLTRPTVLVVIPGESDTAPVVNEVERLRREDDAFTPVYVTSCDDFGVLRGRDASFEYLIPEGEWSDVPGGEPDWAGYVARRLTTLGGVHRASHTVVVGAGETNLAEGALRAIVGGRR